MTHLKLFRNGDSLAQNPAQGDVYTKLYTLPSLATVKYIRGFHIPGATTGSTTQATVKLYFNQNTSADMTFTITLDDVERGWVDWEINKPNVNFIQMEIEWATATTINSDTYRPMYFEVEYADEGRINQ